MPETERAVFKVFINGPITAVWREITKTDELQKGFFNMRLDTNGLKPGGKMRMLSASGKYAGIVGDVLEFDPPHRYVHTFRFTRFDDPPCTISHELREVEGGVEYSMIIDGMEPGTKTAKQMKQGSNLILNTVKRLVETGRPSFGVRMLYVLFKVLEPLSPKKTRAENWPL
jgi:uncharacterized protein YndB with AHSA1/START domain